MDEKTLNQNQKAWERYQSSYPGKYIEKQHAMTDIRYGKGLGRWINSLVLGKAYAHDLEKSGGIAAYENACEVIALYNCFVHEEEISPVPFPKLLDDFEENGIMLRGVFGTRPRALASYVNQMKEYKAIYYRRRQLIDAQVTRLEKEAKSYILTFWNCPRHPFSGIHTVCITKDEGKFAVHNLYCNGEVSTFSSLQEAIWHTHGRKKEHPICLITVRKLPEERMETEKMMGESNED